MKLPRWSVFGLLMLGMAFSTPTVHADDWSYTLRPGDELWSVAKQFCGSARLADQIAEYNQIATPALVRAGMRIRIPTGWLAFAPTGATLVELSGNVEYLSDSATTTQGHSATVGQTINMGGTLVTNAGSALVQFADGSSLTIQPNSRVLFNKLTAFGPAGMVDTHLRFSYGSGTTVVKPQNRGDRFRIETPEGIAAVRGTEFRVGFVADDRLATTETLEGEVAFISRNQTTSLPSGFGVAASPSGVTKESLLPAPNLTTTEAYAADSFLEWQPIANAARYTVTWARQSTPNITALVSQHDINRAEITLPPGGYIAQVRGVSKAGIAGRDATQTFQVLAASPQPIAVDGALTGPGTLKWTAPDSADAKFEVEITSMSTLTSNGFSAPRKQLNIILTPDNYQWRVRGEQTAWSEASQFTVLPSTPTNLTHSSKRKVLTVAWDRVPEADGYKLTVTHANGKEIEVTTTESQAIVELEHWGAHKISVASTHRALQSSPSTNEVTVLRRPWWLIAVALLAFAL